MDERSRLSLIVGAVAMASLVTAAIVLANLGSDAGLLQERYALITYFDDVQGLVSGSPVRLAGKDVGRIREVSFARLEDDRPPMRVVLEVDGSVQDRIRSDSVASIGTIGLLGDKFVSLTMGSPRGRVLQDTNEIASVSPIDLNVAIVRGTEAIDNIALLASNTNKVVEDFGASQGIEGVAAAASALSDIVREVQEGDGMLHSLIYDPYEGDELASAGRSLATLEDMLGEIQGGEGILHDLIYEPANEQLINQTLMAGGRLESILAKIDEGDGTMALLVNDPSLYADLKALVGGARRSTVVKTLVELSTDDE
jgi:phospholipid/cholesterol/gamma-HCH transport system substrate-binding protein